MKRFYDGIESSVEEGGRPAFDPQPLISLWAYAYGEGIGPAREVARWCEFDPAFQWLTRLEEVNYHTLASFRVEKQQELDELFTQVLAALARPDHTGTGDAGRQTAQRDALGLPQLNLQQWIRLRKLRAAPAVR